MQLKTQRKKLRQNFKRCADMIIQLNAMVEIM